MNSQNPYESPTQADADFARSRSLLSIPAVILLFVATLSNLLGTLPGFVIAVDVIRMLQDGFAPYLVAVTLPFVAICISNFVVFYGAIQMLRRRQFRAAMAAAVLSVIPVCSPLRLLGIPFGFGL